MGAGVRASRPSRLSLALTGPLLGLALTACGGETASPAPTPAAAPTVRPATAAATAVAPAATAPTTAPATSAPPAPAGARVVMVNVVDNRFDPVRLEVPVGTTVRWTNNGREDHDVVAADFKSFESPLLKTGQTFEASFAQPIEVAYLCTLHDGMTATLVVR